MVAGRSVFLLFLSLGILSAVATPSPSPQASPSPQPPPQTCLTLGNGDLYGLGVRLGIYLQWFSGFILRNLGSWSVVSRVRTINNALCSALALAAAISIASGAALSVDFILSYYLTVVLFYAESYNLVIVESRDVKFKLGYGTGEARDDGPPEEDDDGDDMFEGRNRHMKIFKLFPDFPLVFQNALFGAYSLFGAWFWKMGIKRTIATTCRERAAVVFLFDLRDGRWLKGAAALSGVAGAIFVVFFLIHVLGLKRGIRHGAVLTAAYYLRPLSGPRLDLDIQRLLNILMRPKALRRGSNMSWPALVFGLFHYTVIFLAGPIIGIVSVERMIIANGLSTPGIAGSAGQMIALFTGICSMLLALWEFGTWWKEDRKKAPPDPVALQEYMSESEIWRRRKIAEPGTRDSRDVLKQRKEVEANAKVVETTGPDGVDIIRRMSV